VSSSARSGARRGLVQSVHLPLISATRTLGKPAAPSHGPHGIT
jgi:hypothetical protein